MAKRKGPGKKKQGAITRRDPDAKRVRREARERERAERGESEEPTPGDDEEDEDGEDEARDEDEGAGDAVEDEAPPTHVGAAWAKALVRLDSRWTWLETRLLVVALALLTLNLCFWFAVRGMQEPLEAETKAGWLWRALFGAAVLAVVTRFATRKRLPEKQRNVATGIALAVGIASASLWRGTGIAYFANVLDWLQEGSSLTLLGGLQGLTTRLTMLVGLIGASLAAATAQHINIDVVLRFAPSTFRRPSHVAGCVAAAIVCFVTSIGFVDFVAVSGFGAQTDGTAGHKIERIQHGLGEHFFLWRKQVALDIGALPNVLSGKTWHEGRMTGADWNRYLDEAGFTERFGAEKVAPVRAPDDALTDSRVPFVVYPGDNARGVVVSSMNLLFPLGFLMIGLRLLLRALLVIAGTLSAEDYPEEDDKPAGEPAKEPV